MIRVPILTDSIAEIDEQGFWKRMGVSEFRFSGLSHTLRMSGDSNATTIAVAKTTMSSRAREGR